METSEIEDMIINCVALGFILQIAAMQHLVMFHSGTAPQPELTEAPDSFPGEG